MANQGGVCWGDRMAHIVKISQRTGKSARPVDDREHHLRVPAALRRHGTHAGHAPPGTSSPVLAGDYVFEHIADLCLASRNFGPTHAGRDSQTDPMPLTDTRSAEKS